MKPLKVLGLMSGTSADGVDAVLVRFHGPPAHPQWKILASHFHPYPPALHERLVAMGQGQCLTAAAVLQLAEEVTEAQAEAARGCDPDGRAALIGCHGQTLWHHPPLDGRRGASWQLLQGPLLAELLDRPVVFDFRSADLARGGHGAPLVPAADAAILGRIGGWRGVLNLGGIANLTLLPPATGPERHAPVVGWDCGPANTLLDLAVQRFSGGQLRLDADGAWARRGQIDEGLIQQWLQEPYFRQLPPKSTGRELFGAADLSTRLEAMQQRLPDSGAKLNPADALATLTAFSAAVVAQDLAARTRPVELLVAGGGARNGFLMEQLGRRCRGLRVQPLSRMGIEEHQREALAFALLAWWYRLSHEGSWTSVTGAQRSGLLGVCAVP
jgi:anhydro-N-acetylmuramic acid kinase